MFLLAEVSIYLVAYVGNSACAFNQGLVHHNIFGDEFSQAMHCKWGTVLE